MLAASASSSIAIISPEPLQDVAPTWEPLENGQIIAFEAHPKKDTLIR